MVVNNEIAGVWFGDSHPVRLMGVLNLGLESFYQGSIVSTQKLAIDRAKQMVTEGAELLDLGAMSTAPCVKKITEEEERSRLLPILKAVLDEVDVPISVDTYRSKIAEDALKLGAKIINDVSGFMMDENMVHVLKDNNAPSILMATKERIGDPLTMLEIINCLKNSMIKAEKVGYDTSNIIIDPAIGRWVPEKTYQYNLDIIRELNQLSELNRIILVGISRKSFIHELLNRPDPNDRLHGTLGATAIAVYNGAHIIRTHDIGVTSDVVRIAQLIRDNRSLK
jgi:dihydropteroate synthase